MKDYNPYQFILFIPLAIIAGTVFYLISYGRSLSSGTFILLILVLMASITYLGYKLSQQNNPLKRPAHERGDEESILKKIIETKKGEIPEEEVANIKVRIQNIYATTYRRAERAMKIKQLMDEYLSRP